MMAGAAQAAKVYPIKHVIFIMQENRSFDSYFGTFPGVTGIPPGTCVPLNPSTPNLGCVAPFHDIRDGNAGALHTAQAAQADLDNGDTTNKMDGFVYQQTQSHACDTSDDNRVNCAAVRSGVVQHDVMGYHTDAEIPNYWSYAKNFVLQDQLFESVRSWSWPSHLYITSEWSAICTNLTQAMSCTSSVTPTEPTQLTGTLPWVNLFQLMDGHGVSWKYYLANGLEPDCDDDEMTCPPQVQTFAVPSFWNPAPMFSSVAAQGSAYLKQHTIRWLVLPVGIPGISGCHVEEHLGLDGLNKRKIVQFASDFSVWEEGFAATGHACQSQVLYEIE